MPAPLIRPGHKYIRREGTPGHYRYFYYDPSIRGSRREAATDEEQAHARVDHVRRLLAAALTRGDALNAGTLAGIAREVGVTPTAVRWELSNMRARGRRAQARGTALPEGWDVARLGHGYEERHLTEAGLGVGTQAYEAVANLKLRMAAEDTPTARETHRRNQRDIARLRAMSQPPATPTLAEPTEQEVARTNYRERVNLTTGLGSLVRLGTRFTRHDSRGDSTWRVDFEGVGSEMIPGTDMLMNVRLVPVRGAYTEPVIMPRADLVARLEGAEPTMRFAYTADSPEVTWEDDRPPAAPAQRLDGVRVGTRLMVINSEGQRTLWQVVRIEAQQEDGSHAYELARVAGGDPARPQRRMTARYLEAGLRLPDDAPGSWRVAYQEGGHASAELDQQHRDQLEAGTAPPVDPTKEVRVGTRLTFGTGEGMRLYEVRSITGARRDGAPSGIDAFSLHDITGRNPDTGISRDGLRYALGLPEHDGGRMRIAFHGQAPGSEAPPTQQTAEARARVAEAAQPRAAPTAAQLVERLARAGLDLDALGIPEAQVEAALGPETPKERRFRMERTLQRRGFDLDALNLPVPADPAA